MSTILVVDDKDTMRDSVATTLERAGYTVVTADSGESAISSIAKHRPDLVVTDLKMPGMTGLELIERVRAIDEDLPLILMTAFGTVDTAVSAMKLGAFDYVTKPFEGDELLIAVKRAIQHGVVVRENALLRAGVAQGQPHGAATQGHRPAATGLDRIIGDSPAIRRVKQQVQALADSQSNVLIVGESGTGKEVIARAIHDLSTRGEGPFLAVNCAALSESLLESELFGHEKGAFTGADRLRKGRFELAHGGTLLLDEVSEVSPAIQAKLLRVLQERAFERVGSSTSIGVDVRVLATSNRDLPKAVHAGQFRQDLFFRLNVLPVHLPPLRDRVEDVPVLAQHFVAQICSREGRDTLTLTPTAIDLLMAYDWPGNVRELQNICERAVVLSQGMGASAIDAALIQPWLLARSANHDNNGTLAARDPLDTVVGGLASQVELKPTPAAGSTAYLGGDEDGPNPARLIIPPGATLDELEREAIVQTLRRFNGHRAKTAKALDIGVRTLGLKLKKWKEERIIPATL